MWKLIIADDERIIRETIAQLIDWESLGIELIGLCRDGIEAYHMILDEAPDLVMTDIRMPGLSGIELVRKVRQTSLKVSFLILSGYDEFAYARELMKYGVKYYLLKPCNEEDMIENLRLAIRDCMEFRALEDALRQEKAPSGMESALPEERGNADAFAERIMAYVEKHLHESDLTLKKIAEEYLFMNVDYVSRQFKKSTNRKFSQYLTEQRIRRAKRIMRTEENVKLSYLAQRVGCGNNPQYFSQIFKKAEGVTPAKYMERLQSGETAEQSGHSA